MAPEKVQQRQRATGAGLDGIVDLARDRDLVERCQGGDRSGFEELYHRYHRRLFHFCLRRLHEPYEAEDAVQEAFTKAWRALPNFAGERRFYPWLTVIAGNVCTDILRRRSRLTPVDDVPLPLVDPDARDVDELVLREVDVAMVAQALGKLSDRHQRVLQLREGSGWSTQQLAEYEGVAVPAMETLLWRARQALKREFTALAETGSRLGIALGLGLAAFRRFVLRATTRATARAAEHLPALQASSFRGPGALAASLVIAGGVVVGVAATHGGSPAAGQVAMAPTASTGSPVTAPSTVLASPLPAGSVAPGAAPVTTTAGLGDQPAITPGTDGGTGGAAATGASTSGGGASGATSALGASTLPTGAGSAATGTLGSALSGAGSTVSSVVGGVGSTASSVVKGAGSTVSSVVSGAGSTASSVVDGVGSTASSVVTTLAGTLSGVTGGLGGAVGGLTGGSTTTGAAGLPGGL